MLDQACLCLLRDNLAAASRALYTVGVYVQVEAPYSSCLGSRCVAMHSVRRLSPDSAANSMCSAEWRTNFPRVLKALGNDWANKFEGSQAGWRPRSMSDAPQIRSLTASDEMNGVYKDAHIVM